MVTVDDVLASMEKNPFIDAGIKENIRELVLIFVKFFPNISLQNLVERLKTLTIEKTNPLVSKKIFDYNPVTNVLSFQLHKIEQDYDIRHVLMHTLLCIITAHDNTYGFDQNEKFMALNAGYTEILTNFLVGNNRELTLFDEEVIAANLVAEMVGNDVLFEAYFNNDPNMLASALLSQGDDFQ